MAASDNTRVNQNAVMAARALLGSEVLSEEVAVELVETIRVHLERPYQLALVSAQRENAQLRALVDELTSTPTAVVT